MTNFAEHPDVLGHSLIKHDLAPNLCILDINGALQADDQGDAFPWNLPSRLMRFPIVYGRASFDDSGRPIERAISLMHPDLGAHPFVQKVQGLLSIEIPYLEGVRINCGNKLAAYHHAVDLISEQRFQDLISTRSYSTPDAIISAINYGLCYGPRAADKRSSYEGCLTLQQARQLLSNIGIDLPGVENTILDDLRECDPPDSGAINFPYGMPQIERVERLIIGIEQGAYQYKNGFLRWVKKLSNSQMMLL